MKKQSLKVLAFALILGLAAIFGSANSTFAQTTTSVSFDVAFDFQIGKARWTAGRYNLRKIGDEVFRLSDEKRKRSILIPVTASLDPANALESEKLIFNKYGEQYFLREIYARRRAVGHSINESNSEKQARRRSEAKAETLARVGVTGKSAASRN